MTGLTPPDHLTDEQVVYWKELVNRVHAAVDATDTPDDAPTMEQVEVIAQNIPGADDPHVGFQSLPDGWDRSTVLEVWTKVGGSFTSCKTKFVSEEGWSPNKADRFCAALKDEVRQSEEWREGGGQAHNPLSMVPGVPSNPNRITRDMLEDIVRWKMAQLRERAATAASLPPLATSLNGTVEFAADWNPSLHPRDPETGQFVERPWPGDILPDDLNNTPTADLVEFLGDTEGEPDMDAILSDDSIRIDGIPDDVNSISDLKARKANPTRDADVPTNPKDYTELANGDVVRMPDGSPATVLQKQGDGDILVQGPDGDSEILDMNTVRRNTLDVYDVEAMSELPSQGGGGRDIEREVDLSDLSMDHPAWESTMDMANTLSAGDIVQVTPGEFDSAGGRRRADYEPARILEKDGNELTVEFADGTRQTVDRNENYRVGSVFNPPSGVSGDPAAEWVGLDPSDPENGEWGAGTNDNADVGDVVKFNSPRTMEHEVGKITGKRANGGFRVQTPDGEMFSVSEDESRDNEVWELTGVFREEPDMTPDDFAMVDDRETVNLTDMDGTPAERRAAVQGEFLSDETISRDAVLNEEIPEGAVIAREGSIGGGTVYPARVKGYEDGGSYSPKKLVVETNSGDERTLRPGSVEDKYRPYKPADEPEVTIPDNEWGDEDTPLAHRKDAVKSVLDDVVTHADDDPANDDGTLDDETFEQAKETTARHLARAKDKEHAEKVAARLTSIGERGRAHAVIEQNTWGTTTAYFSVDEDEDDDTIVHELGHVVGDVYDFKGGSNDKDGETYPMPTFKWQSPKFDTPQKYGLKTPPWSDDFEDGKNVRSQPSYNLNEWKDEVDGQVGNGLDGRNFTNVESNSDLPLQEGAMIRLNRTPSYGEPKNWRIAEVEENPPEFPSEVKVVLEDRNGNRQPGFIDPDRQTARIGWADEADYRSWTDITGKRNDTPDDWTEDPPDPDDWLGTMDPDDSEQAVRNLGNFVNKAWYRQAAASREQGEDSAARYNIKSGYSAKQAHETWSRIHEVMRPTSDTSNEEMANAAHTLVTKHPDLLEAYQQVYDIPTTMTNALNEILEREGADFRLPGGTDLTAPGDVEMVEDVIAEKYNEGEF